MIYHLFFCYEAPHGNVGNMWWIGYEAKKLLTVWS